MNIAIILLSGLLAVSFAALFVLAIVFTVKKKKAVRLWLGAGFCILATIPLSLLGIPASERAALPAPTKPPSILEQVEALTEAGEYEEAAQVLEKNITKREVAWPDISRLFEGHMDEVDIKLLHRSPSSDENDMDGAATLDAILQYKMQDYRAYFMDRVSTADILESSGFSYEHNYRFSPYEASGTDPKGKILVYQMNDAGGAPSHAHTRTILLGAAALLDDRYIPECIAEVQFLLLLNYDLEYYGTYENTVVASKVIASLQLFEYPGGGMIHDFGTIKGGNPPHKIPDHTDKVVRGSYPEQEEVTNLLLAAIEQINEEPETVF